jgi:hypothetical protein
MAKIDSNDLPSGTFHGPIRYLELKDSLKFGTVIRVRAYRSDDLGSEEDSRYVIGPSVSSGRLESAVDLYSTQILSERRDLQTSRVEAKVILSKDNAPKGWCFDGISLDFFSDKILKEITDKGLLE